MQRHCFCTTEERCADACVNVHKNLESSVYASLLKIFPSGASFRFWLIFPSCYSATAGLVAMATAILEWAKLFPNSGLKENSRQKQVSLHTLLVSS